MRKANVLATGKRTFLAAVLCCGLAPAQTSSSVASGIVDRANAFLGSLDEAQRSKVLFDFNDAAQRVKWSNLPTTMVPRAGLKMGDLSAPQKQAAMGLLAATLSKRGYEKVLAIVEGDEALKIAGGGRGGMFGHDLFYISILGKPSVKDPWMLQFGGHHLALNITHGGSRRDPHAQPYRGAAGEIYAGRQNRAPARSRERQGLRADQCAGRRAAEAGHSELQSGRSRAGAGPGRKDHSAGRHQVLPR